MSPVRKVALRRARFRERAAIELRALNERDGDTYEHYRNLYGLWCSNNAAVPELTPLFGIPGIVADSSFSVTTEFKEKVRPLASELLPAFNQTERNT